MKEILFLIILLATVPFLAQAEELGVKVQTNGQNFEVKTGSPPPPPTTKVFVVHPSNPQVVEKTTIVQPSGGCGLFNVDL